MSAKSDHATFHRQKKLGNVRWTASARSGDHPPQKSVRCKPPSQSFLILLALFASVALAADTPTIDSFDSNGVTISYSVQGKDQPVVLIHGWLSIGRINWDLPGTSDLLAKNFQKIVVDVRGQGSSGKPTKSNAYGMELVDDIARLLDHLQMKKAHIVGYSMSGIITANFLATYADRALSGTFGGSVVARRQYRTKGFCSRGTRRTASGFMFSKSREACSNGKRNQKHQSYRRDDHW